MGLGEAIYFLTFGKFIPVTTGLAKMFSTVEANITHTSTISKVYSPDVHWIIIGALLGAWLVGRLEGESRNWVKYSPGMLLVAFLGGIIFGFGTRLGPGCTTHHIFGGLAVMSVASWTIAVLGLPFAFLAFELVARLGYGPYFKHQETRSVCQTCRNAGLDDDHRLVLDEKYNPWKSWLRMGAWSIVAVVIVSSLYTGFFGASGQALGSGPLWPNIIRLIAGACLGFGIAKAGVGTECGLMAPESLLVPESHYRKLNIPVVTQRMFQALLPVSGVLAAILVLNIAVLVMWLGFGWPVPNAAPKPQGWGLHIGHLLAAPCLAIGSVFMIGCEIRTYGRVGLGYLTGIVGLIGFYFGYLPYVYFQGAIDGFIANHTFLRATNIPELLTSDPVGQKVVGVAYTVLLASLFVLVVVQGAKRIGASPVEYLTVNTDDLVLRNIDAIPVSAPVRARTGRPGRLRESPSRPADADAAHANAAARSSTAVGRTEPERGPTTMAPRTVAPAAMAEADAQRARAGRGAGESH
ncbi:MAG TPA: hypothetical protein EYP56_11145 [Planctomycetaceae bacterium]|nr:hypothetical protein [Planctomycetaceae bacterium]